MAGGLAQRLNMGEKACIQINNKSLISYIINSLQKSKFIEKIYVSTTNNTPITKKMVEKYYPSIRVINTIEGNYVKDMINAVK